VRRPAPRGHHRRLRAAVLASLFFPSPASDAKEYLDALVKRADFPSFFTEDVVATFEGTDQRADGREAAAQLIRYVHEGAFDARMELKNLLADDGKAAIEADFAALIPPSSPESSPRAGQSGCRTRSFTTCAAIRSAH
jgi:hypothetical protein